MKIIRQIVMGVAALATALMPTVVSAQSVFGQEQYSVRYEQPSSEMVQTRVELAKGFTLTPEEAVSIGNYGCVVGPMATTTRELYEWAERKGVTPCTPDFYKKVDSYIGKESTLAFRAMAGADGFEYCPNMKVANLGNNRESCRTYPYNPDYNPAGQVGKYADVNWAQGGGTTKAQVATALGGALISGPLTAATGQLLAPKCRGNCGGSNVYNLVEGATALAASEANAVTDSAVNVALGACATGTCGASAPSAKTEHD